MGITPQILSLLLNDSRKFNNIFQGVSLVCNLGTTETHVAGVIAFKAKETEPGT